MAAAAWVLLPIGAFGTFSATELSSNGKGLPAFTQSAPPALPQIGLPDTVPEHELFIVLDPATAKQMNSARPFSNAPNHPARPFQSHLVGDERARARECLAIAALYEAGSDEDDQSAVVQVILNRVRHPAFPNSVCGVVFQGAERSTGCQFSFTCDGSMRRWSPSSRMLERARNVADRMLADQVDKRVGLATHYHTDWVLPYWSSSLDKVAAVETHLFFRWPGYWGKLAAMSQNPAVAEPSISLLASFNPLHGPGSEDQAAAPTGMDAVIDLKSASQATIAKVLDAPEPRKFEKKIIDPAHTPGRWALNAVSDCRGRSECRIAGWVSAESAPADLSRSALMLAQPDFVYVQELRNRVQQSYWNCDKWPPASSSKCLGSPSQTASLLLD